MVVHRRPNEVQAEVPAAVYALDLARVSELLHIPESELLWGISADPTAAEMQGVIVDAGEDVPFETVGLVDGDDVSIDVTPSHARAAAQRVVGGSTPKSNLPPLAPGSRGLVGSRTPTMGALTPSRRPSVRQVLITAAVHPSSLDDNELPKCLIQLGSQTIIGHILTQLYAAGIERVVISVAAGGSKIKAAVKQTPFYTKMQIEFLDLGRDYDDGHARSILAARKLFPKGPFLIHTADHIFDKSIVTKMAKFSLNEAVACVLVETEIAGLSGLPPTSVRVRMGKENVTKIARELERFDGIDAGLFLSSTAIFDALEDLAAKKEYFSLAEALDYFTKFNKLTYLPTAGETWFSIETEEQLAYTKDTDGTSVLSPWTVFLASTPRDAVAGIDLGATKNVVIGVSAAEESSLRVAGKTDASKLFNGIIVGVNNADYVDDEASAIGDGTEFDSESRPLLSIGTRRSTFLGSARSRFSHQNSFIEKGAGSDEPFVLSFPVDDDTSKTVEDLKSTRHAYLIEMSPDPAGYADPSAGSEYMLAIPGQLSRQSSFMTTPRSVMTPTPVHHRKKAILPSDITQISLETRGYDDNLEVKVVVQRTAPLIGYLLLLSSLFTVSSVGVALDMVDGVAPLLKLFWRQTATCSATVPLMLFAMWRNGPPKFTRKLVLTMVAAGAAYGFYLGSYVVSLSYTSVGHATLFNNSHSLLLVFVKLAQGLPVVPFEGIGAAVGVIGGGITAMDATKAGENIVSPTVYGDIIALVGASGGALYFTFAKKLRAELDLVVFMCFLTATSASCLLMYMLVTGENISLSTDPHHGMFGWTEPVSDRLFTVCYLVFVCDLIGTMGYISVMKYFDPIVVSVVCLVEPIVATIQGIVMGVDAIPGWLTFVGAMLVIGGTFMVLSTQAKKTESIDATEAVLAANSTPKPLYSTRTARRRNMQYGSGH